MMKQTSLQKRASTRILNKLKTVVVCLVMSALSEGVYSHQFLTEILTEQNIGSNVSFVPVMNYQLTEEQILAINNAGPYVDYYAERDQGFVAVARDPAESCLSGGSKTCGQFDHFSQARAAAVTTCFNLGNQSPELYPNGLIPLYLGPGSFVNLDTASADHHLNYTLAEGLNFNCGYMTVSPIKHNNAQL